MITLPSAQLFIASSGRTERCIEVVHIQCGKPRATITAQKANMIRRRVDMKDDFSGGGTNDIWCKELSDSGLLPSSSRVNVLIETTYFVLSYLSTF